MSVVITPFPHQNIPIMTPFSLNINVSGNPTNISVDGRLKGFYYNWTGTQIQLRGTPEFYADDIEVVVTADNETYTGTVSIVPISPIIGTLNTVTVRRGVAISVPIPITGHVSELVIQGPWIGLKYRITDTGGEMYGTIPVSNTASFTARTFNYSVTAYNGVSFDTATLTLEFEIGA